MENKKELTSDFGQGFTYCIGLFLAHQHMMIGSTKRECNLWFNGASDHLYELEVPENFVMKDECQAWKELVLNYGHGMQYLCGENLTEKDVSWALEKAREYLMAWDKQCGIEVSQGRYE